MAGAHKEEGTRPGHMHLVISLIKWDLMTLALSSLLSCLLPFSVSRTRGELPGYLKRVFQSKILPYDYECHSLHPVFAVLVTVLRAFCTLPRILTTPLSSRFRNYCCKQEETKALSCQELAQRHLFIDETGVLKWNLPMPNTVFLPSLSIANTNVFPSNWFWLNLAWFHFYLFSASSSLSCVTSLILEVTGHLREPSLLNA